MKKMFALLLMILFLGGCFAQTESAESVYDVLTHLMNGRSFTLTVTAESDAGVCIGAAGTDDLLQLTHVPLIRILHQHLVCLTRHLHPAAGER